MVEVGKGGARLTEGDVGLELGGVNLVLCKLHEVADVGIRADGA